MYNFYYDPQRNGYDTGLWKTLAGTPAIASNKLVLNGDEIIQYSDCVRGVYTFAISFPSVPNNSLLTGGTSATIQLTSILTCGTAATSVVATWDAVTNGAFQVTVDGVALDIIGIDFTGVADMDAVAVIIQAALQTASGGTETVIWDTDHFVITAYTSITVLTAGSAGTDISGAGATSFMDGDTGNGVVTSGWRVVTDGEFAITIDDVAYDVLAIDFTGVADMDAVAALIQAGIRAETSASETVVWSTDHFIITTIINVTVTSAVSGGGGTDISGAGATTFMDCETAVGTVTDGDDKEFGLKQKNQDIYAVAKMTGLGFQFITKNANGDTEITNIPWDATWTAAETVFRIHWSGQGFMLTVGSTVLASHNSSSVFKPMSVYLRNSDADNMIIGYVEGLGIESYL